MKLDHHFLKNLPNLLSNSYSQFVLGIIQTHLKSGKVDASRKLYLVMKQNNRFERRLSLEKGPGTKRAVVVSCFDESVEALRVDQVTAEGHLRRVPRSVDVIHANRTISS